MPNITPRTNKNGEIVSYRIRVAAGYSASGEKIKPYEMTWKPAPGMTKKQIEKELKVILLETVDTNRFNAFFFFLFGNFEFKTLNHFIHFKLCKETCNPECIGVGGDIITVAGFNRSVCADCAEVTAQICHILIVDKLIVNTFFSFSKISSSVMPFRSFTIRL